MGGKKGGGGGSAKPKQDPFYAYLKQMQDLQSKQFEASKQAQKEALLQSQTQTGLQAEQLGEQEAKQQLGLTGAMQQIRDAATLQQMQQAQAAAGTQATGGGYDMGLAREQALANIGAAAGSLPATMQNIPTSISPVTPANVNLPSAAKTTSKTANLFTAPNLSNIQFGGA